MTGDVTGEVSSDTRVNSETKTKTFSVFFHRFDADYTFYNIYILFRNLLTHLKL